MGKHPQNERIARVHLMGKASLRERIWVALQLSAQENPKRTQRVTKWIRGIQFNRARGRISCFLKRELTIRRQPKEERKTASQSKCVECQHTVRVECQCLLGLPNRLLNERLICLALSLPNMSRCPEGDFVSSEIIGAPPRSLRLFGRLNL